MTNFYLRPCEKIGIEGTYFMQLNSWSVHHSSGIETRLLTPILASSWVTSKLPLRSVLRGPVLIGATPAASTTVEEDAGLLQVLSSSHGGGRETSTMLMPMRSSWWAASCKYGATWPPIEKLDG